MAYPAPFPPGHRKQAEANRIRSTEYGIFLLKYDSISTVFMLIAISFPAYRQIINNIFYHDEAQVTRQILLNFDLYFCTTYPVPDLFKIAFEKGTKILV